MGYFAKLNQLGQDIWKLTSANLGVFQQLDRLAITSNVSESFDLRFNESGSYEHRTLVQNSLEMGKEIPSRDAEAVDFSAASAASTSALPHPLPRKRREFISSYPIHQSGSG